MIPGFREGGVREKGRQKRVPLGIRKKRQGLKNYNLGLSRNSSENKRKIGNISFA